MATTVGSHSISTFATPVNGGPLDANVVRGNDNTIKTAYVNHDADPGIHVQSSTLASRPAAGTAGRKWITEDSGVYTLWFDDGTNWHPVSSENVALTVLATENLVKGDVVKVTGWNNGQDLPEVAKVSSASDTAFAIITAAVTSGAMGYATNTGIVQDLATNGFSVGAILYPNTSGGFTATKPTSGTYQACAYVLRSNANNGVLYVEFSAPRIVESSANTASTVVQRDASGNFSAGTITAGALTSTGLVTFASLKGTGATTVTDILNDGTMATASATTLATSASIKTYVDAQVGASDALSEVLAIGNTTGANDIIVSTGQKIRTPAVAAGDGSAAITIANTTGALTLATALADSNLATISTAGKVANSATTATSANTASAIVARDGSGNFSAGTITATLSGTATQVSQALTAGTYLTSGGTYNGSTARTFAVDATDANTASKVVARDASGNFAAGTITATLNGAAPAGSLSGSTLASGVTASSLTSVGTLTSLAVSGDLTVDTNTLSVNATSNRVGIGTTSAVWNSSEKLVVSQSVDAPVITGYSTFGAGTPVLVSWNSATSGTREHIWFADSASGGVRGKIATNGANGLQFLYGSTVGMSLDSSGRVGVGTASPGSTLDVVGTARIANASGNKILQLGQSTPSANDGSSLEFQASSTQTNWAIRTNWNVPGALEFNPSSSAGGTTYTTPSMLLTSSGNLGLGVTPSFDLEVTKSKPSNTVDLMVKNTGTTGTSNARLLVYVDSTSGGDPKMGVGITAVRDYFWYIDNSDSDKLKLSDSGTDILEIIDGSSLALKGASSASGTGITFPATQSASSNANTLDDYEEGTFTPTVYGEGTAGTTTYTAQVGRYTKIGRQVTATFTVTYSAATGTGTLRLGGLPFSAPAGPEFIGAVMIGLINSPATGSYNSYLSNGDSLAFYVSTDDTGIQNFIMSNESGEIWGTITYFA